MLIALWSLLFSAPRCKLPRDSCLELRSLRKIDILFARFSAKSTGKIACSCNPSSVQTCPDDPCCRIRGLLIPALDACAVPGHWSVTVCLSAHGRCTETLVAPEPMGSDPQGEERHPSRSLRRNKYDESSLLDSRDAGRMGKVRQFQSPRVPEAAL